VDQQELVAVSLLAARYVKRLHANPYCVDPQVLPAVSRAVYVAVDGVGTVRYVGSTSRRGAALPQRFKEHLRHRQGAGEWTHVWVVELHEDTPLRTVRWVEGHIGALLGPTDNHRLPRTSTRSRAMCSSLPKPRTGLDPARP
jgi:hypothetical protein